MSRDRPEPDCRDLHFQARYALPDAAEVALEDYARALTRSRAAVLLRAEDDPRVVAGVHVCGLPAPPGEAALADLEDFARDMSARAGEGGLGWS
jgi:hypothetical protein